MSAAERFEFKYQARCPRYFHHPLDSNKVEFSIDHDDDQDSTNENMVQGHYHDISYSGMRFFTPNPTETEVGDKIILSFTPPGVVRTITVLAEVVRRQGPCDVAVRFIELTKKDAELFNQAMNTPMHSDRFFSIKRIIRSVIDALPTWAWAVLFTFALSLFAISWFLL